MLVTAVHAEAFVLAHTGLAQVPYVPVIRTYQADDAIALWEETERLHGGPGVAPPFWAFPWAGGQALARPESAGYQERLNAFLYRALKTVRPLFANWFSRSARSWSGQRARSATATRSSSRN